MMQVIKKLKVYEIALTIFSGISIATILFGIYALAFNAIMGGMRDIVYIIGVTFSTLFLFLATIIVIRKIHLKPQSSIASKIGYCIVLPLCVLLWSISITSSNNLVFDKLFAREPMQTTIDGRLEYRLSIYNLRQRHQRVELFIRDNKTGVTDTFLLEIPFDILGITGGGSPYAHRIEMVSYEEYSGLYLINTLYRMHHAHSATFIFNVSTWEIVYV